MKILTIILTLGFVGLSYGQGYVNVNGTQQNYTNATLLTTSWTGGTNTTGNGVLPSTGQGGSFKLALISTTSGTPITSLFGDASLNTDWQWTGLLGANNTFAGRLVIGAGLQAPSNAPVGVSVSWMLVGWSTSLGADWATVSAQLIAGNFGANTGFIGWSLIGAGAAGAAPPATALVITGSPSPIIPVGFSLQQVAPVPEPSTMALAALGGAALLLFRRRK